MQPGKPQGFGVTDDGMLLFGLPGNPVSAAVSFEVVRSSRASRPAGPDSTCTGRSCASRPPVGWRTPPGPTPVPARRDRPHRPRALDGPRRRQSGGSGSHLAGGLARAEAYAVVAADVDAVAPGDLVDVMLICMSFTHLDESGRARMVDVTAKAADRPRSDRTRLRPLLAPRSIAALRDGTVPKGDVLAVARIAGIQAAKRTPDLLPLAHVIGVHGAVVDLDIVDDGVEIEATVRTADRTGVEMEALTAVSVAALAIVDMVKGLDKATSIENVRITAKEGGRSGVLDAARRVSDTRPDRPNSAGRARLRGDPPRRRARARGSAARRSRSSTSAVRRCSHRAVAAVVPRAAHGRSSSRPPSSTRRSPSNGSPRTRPSAAPSPGSSPRSHASDLWAPEPEWTFVLACDLPRVDAAVARLTTDILLLPSDTEGVCLADASSRPQWLTGVYRTAALRRGRAPRSRMPGETRPSASSLDDLAIAASRHPTT